MITILIDSREQKNWHITNYLKQRGIAYETTHIITGDYSFKIGAVDYREQFAIERKAHFNEIVGNITKMSINENSKLRVRAQIEERI